jgi:hypothetical protein
MKPTLHSHYGRIFKTLHVLTFVDDPHLRRQLKAMRNLQEGRLPDVD